MKQSIHSSYTFIQRNNSLCERDDKFQRVVARYLYISLMIKPGKSLAPHIGFGDEVNNIEAVYSWVNIVFTLGGIPRVLSQISMVEEMLRQTIEAIEADLDTEFRDSQIPSH